MLRFIALFLTIATAAAADMNHDAQLRVIPGWQTPQGTHMAGLHITLSPGWKTYWRAPGEGGIPPEISFGGSININAAQFHWPTPVVFDQNGMRSIGYEGGVVLPLELTPRSDGPMHLSGTLNIGVCDDICIPVRFDFDAALPISNKRDPVLLGAMISRPLSAQEAGVSNATCAVSPTEDGLAITTAVDLPPLGREEVMVIETTDPNIWVSQTEAGRDRSQVIGQAEMIALDGQAVVLDRSEIRITVLADGKAVDIMGCSGG